MSTQGIISFEREYDPCNTFFWINCDAFPENIVPAIQKAVSHANYSYDDIETVLKQDKIKFTREDGEYDSTCSYRYIIQKIGENDVFLQIQEEYWLDDSFDGMDSQSILSGYLSSEMRTISIIKLV